MVKNIYGIRNISIDAQAKCYCPLGRDWYTNHFTIDIEVAEDIPDYVELDKTGYIKAGEDCKTSSEGIFAAGDIRTKPLRQVVTAVADGATAVQSVERYLHSR